MEKVTRRFDWHWSPANDPVLVVAVRCGTAMVLVSNNRPFVPWRTSMTGRSFVISTPVKKFFVEDAALGATEYGVLLGLIALSAIVALVLLGMDMGATYSSIGRNIPQ
jgi:Flp pilus assembly pilin Flp